jgi:hypothetical protein
MTKRNVALWLQRLLFTPAGMNGRVRMWRKGERARRKKARKLAHRMRLANRRRP